MAISDANKNKLNKMNRVAKDATLGTVVQTAENNIATAQSNITSLQTAIRASGCYVVQAADASASKLTLYNALATKGAIYTYYMSGSPKTQSTWYQVEGGSHIIAGSGVGVIRANDTVRYILF